MLVNEGEPYGAEGAGHLRIVHGCFVDEERALDAYRRIATAITDLAAERGITAGQTR